MRGSPFLVFMTSMPTFSTMASNFCLHKNTTCFTELPFFFKKPSLSFSAYSVKMDPTGRSQAAENQRLVSYQNVVVMRHGDRIDNFEPTWVSTAARPWDPPLVQAGKVRACKTGLRLRLSLGFSINRVFVSPFLRCVQ